MSAAGSPRLAEPQALTDIRSLLDYEPEHHWFRDNVRAFVRGRILPFHGEWESAGIIDGSLFTAAGKRGLLGFSVPEKLGGPAVDDVRHNAIVVEEEVNRVGAAAEGIALTLQNVVLPYLSELTTGEQKARWLPSVVTTDTVLAIAMTEPGAESDLTGIRTAAVRDGDHYVVGGAKMFISNDRNRDLLVVATTTSPDEHKGLTLLVIDGYSCLIARMQRVAAASGSRAGAGSNRDRADSGPRAP